MQKHTIKNPIFEIIWNVNSLAWNKWESNAKDLIYNKLLPIAEKVFDNTTDENTTIKIDKLTIDLGEIALNELQGNIEYIFETKLKEALRDKIPQVKKFKPNIQNTKDERFQSFIYFLETGRDTWWISTSPTQQQEVKLFENQPLVQLFKQITEENPELLRIFLQQQPVNSAIMQRFFLTIPFEKWLDALYLHRKEIVIFWQSFFNELVFLLSKKTFKPIAVLKSELYQFILKKAIDDNYFFNFGNEKENLQIEFLSIFLKNLPDYSSDFKNNLSKKSLLFLKIAGKDMSFFQKIMQFFGENTQLKSGFLFKNFQKTFQEYANELKKAIQNQLNDINIWNEFENLLPENQKIKLQLLISIYKKTLEGIFQKQNIDFLENYLKQNIIDLSINREEKIFLQPNFEQIIIDFLITNLQKDTNFFRENKEKIIILKDNFVENLQKTALFQNIISNENKIKEIVQKEDTIKDLFSSFEVEKSKENEVFFENNLIDILQTILSNQAQEILQLLQKLSDSFGWFGYTKAKWKQFLWENLAKVLWENRFQTLIENKQIIQQFFENLQQNSNVEKYIWQNFMIRNDIKNAYSFNIEDKKMNSFEIDDKDFILKDWFLTLRKYELTKKDFELIDKFWIEISYIFSVYFVNMQNTVLSIFKNEIELLIQKNKNIFTEKKEFLWIILQKIFENNTITQLEKYIEIDLNRIALFKENSIKFKKIIEQNLQNNQTKNLLTLQQWKKYFGVDTKLKREKILRQLLPLQAERIIKFLDKVQFKLTLFSSFMTKSPAERQKITWEILADFFYQNQKNEQWTNENLFNFFENYLFETLKIYPQYYADIIELLPAARKRVRNTNYIEKILLYFWEKGEFAWTEIWKFYTSKTDNSLEQNINFAFEFLAQNNPNRLLEIIKMPISEKNYQKIIKIIDNQQIKNLIIENKNSIDETKDENKNEILLSIPTIFEQLKDFSNQKITILEENLIDFFEKNDEFLYQVWKKLSKIERKNLLQIYPNFFEKVENFKNKLSISTIFEQLENLSTQKIDIPLPFLQKFYQSYPEFLHLIWKDLSSTIKENLLKIYPDFFEKLDIEVETFREQFEKIAEDILKNDYLPRLEERKNSKDDLETLEKLKDLAKKSLHKKKEWQNEPIYIQNAGAVILHPYLWRLFGVLELLENNELKDEIAATKAVHLLNYLVFKSIEGDESQWILNKILLGIPIEKTLLPDITLTEKEMEMCESLLQGIINNWTALRQTSNDNLRVSFLQREGKLTDEPDNWVLRVQNSGFDILLERLPWGLNPLKTPAMKKIMVVEWF